MLGPEAAGNRASRLAHAALKSDLLLKLLYAEMGKEPLWMPRAWGA